MMRKTLFLLLTLAVAALPAGAQSTTPAGEVFLGYSYLRGDFGERHGNLNAVAQAEAAANLNRFFGLVGEVSTHHGQVRGANVDHQLFLFGPRVSLRTAPVTPFVHGLFGFHRTRVGFPGSVQPGTRDKGFSFAVGTGLDANFSRGVAAGASRLCISGHQGAHGAGSVPRQHPSLHRPGAALGQALSAQFS